MKERLNARSLSQPSTRYSQRNLRWSLGAVALTLLVTAELPAVADAGASSRSAAIAEASKVLIVKSDFPAGWTTSPSDNSNSDLGDAQVAACLGVPVSALKYNPPSAYSPDFNFKSTGASVSDDVSVFPNATTEHEQVSIYSSARTPVCFARALNTPSLKRTFERQIGTGAKLGVSSATWLARPKVGDGATALKMSIPFTYRGASYSLTITVVTMVSRLVAAQLTFTTDGTVSIPSSLAAHLEAVTAQRLM